VRIRTMNPRLGSTPADTNAFQGAPDTVLIDRALAANTFCFACLGQPG
jgi:hypothetical protein